MRRVTLTGPFAVFSDVHGNLPGLEAILADVERRGVAGVLSLGDLVGYGPFPNEVAALVRDRHIPSLMGNYDQGIGFSLGDCGCVYETDEQRHEGAVSLAWTDEVTTEETRTYLRTLEDRFILETPAGELLAVHGSPRRINEYLFEDRPESAMARMAAQNPYRAILFGHTHIPYARDVGPDGDWRVCYALVDPAALAEGRAAVEFARVPFDYERLARALDDTDLVTGFESPPATGDARQTEEATWRHGRLPSIPPA